MFVPLITILTTILVGTSQKISTNECPEACYCNWSHAYGVCGFGGAVIWFVYDAEFLFMYPIALAMDVVAFVPSFMMSLTLAMSIDYSLFLLSRFCEARRHGTPTLLGF